MSIGLALSERFYATAVAPLIAVAMPGLNYGAARLGNGSEVLGFDTTMSADHNYGPMVQIFLSEADFADHAIPLMRELDRQLPAEIDGWSTRFPSFGRPMGRPGWLCSDHGIELVTLEAMLRTQLGISLRPPTPLEWLGFPEQQILTLTAGAVFRDDAGTLSAVREQLAWFPRDIWLLRLAAQWSRIGEERAFVGRTGELGDDLGSRLVAARLVHNLMRLAFLVERRYAPYAKWLGTAFARLESAPRLAPMLEAALAATAWQDRERCVAEAAHLVGLLQLERGIPGAVPPRIHRYFGRPFQVINADEIANGLRAAIEDPEIRALPDAGAVDQFSDSTAILTQPALAHDLARTVAHHARKSV
jgi:hypothetical protein